MIFESPLGVNPRFPCVGMAWPDLCGAGYRLAPEGTGADGRDQRPSMAHKNASAVTQRCAYPKGRRRSCRVSL